MDRGFLKKRESGESSFPQSPVPGFAPAPWFAGATGRVTPIIPASLAPSPHSPFLRRLSGRLWTSGSKPIFPAPIPDTWRLPDHGLSFLFVFNILMDADGPGATFDANPALPDIQCGGSDKPPVASKIACASAEVPVYGSWLSERARRHNRRSPSKNIIGGGAWLKEVPCRAPRRSSGASAV